MHDTLDYWATDPLYRRWHHHQLTFGLTYAWAEHFVLPLSHDEVVHLKRSLLGEDARRDRRRALRQPARALRVDVGPPRPAAALHGRRAGRAARVVARPRRSTGACSTTPATPACRRWSASSTRVEAAPPRPPRRRRRPGRLRVARRRRRRPQHLRVRAAPSPAATAWSSCVANLAGIARHGYRVGLPPAGRWRGRAHHRRRALRRPRRLARRTSRPRPCRGTAARTRPCSRSRRSSVTYLVPH